MDDKVILPPGAYILKKYIHIIEEKYINYPYINFLKKGDYNYIVIEGIDGVGKTTVTQLVVSKLRDNGIEAEYVWEPYTDEIRSLLNRSPNINPIAEAFLFSADRAYLHSEVLSKLLMENRAVVSDRSFIASLVYQVARGAPEELVYSLNAFAIRPSLVILLDAPPEVALRRLGEKKKKQLLHLEKSDYLGIIRQRYFEVLEKLNVPFKVIDASRELQPVLDDVYHLIRRNLI